MTLPSLGNLYVSRFPHGKGLLFTISAEESRSVWRWMLLSHHGSAINLSLKDTNNSQIPQSYTAAAAEWQSICKNLFSLIFQAKLHAKLTAHSPRALPGYFASHGSQKHISIWSIHKITCTEPAHTGRATCRHILLDIKLQQKLLKNGESS